MKGPELWWKREPSPRDRALLSLLAGNFPAIPENKVHELSAADAIRAEVRAINALTTHREKRSVRAAGKAAETATRADAPVSRKCSCPLPPRHIRRRAR
jgi:hypothetical protein